MQLASIFTAFDTGISYCSRKQAVILATSKGGSDTFADIHSVEAWLDATARHRHRALPGCRKFQGEECTSCSKTSSLTLITEIIDVISESCTL